MATKKKTTTPVVADKSAKKLSKIGEYLRSTDKPIWDLEYIDMRAVLK